VSQVASTQNHVAFVIAAVNRVINRTTASNDTLLMTTLHCNIYLTLKYHRKYVFFCEQQQIDENVRINCIVVCATRGYINIANL